MDSHCGALPVSPCVYVDPHLLFYRDIESTIKLKSVIAGSVHVNGSGGQVRTIDKFIAHPNHSTVTYSHDVALIHISPPFELDNKTIVVALPKATDDRFLRDDDNQNRTVWVTGFGVTVGVCVCGC
jgi:hypothetical protein